MNPLISIIVPIYNADKYLNRCLNSIITQSYQYLEIILVNDGSTDKSSVICDEYASKDDRIIVIHKQNEGVSEARNSALDIATGDYIHCTDADDWLETNTYQILAETIIKSPDCDIVKFNTYNSDNEVVNKISFIGEFAHERLDEVVLTYIGAPKFGGTFILGVPWMYLFSRKMIEKHHIRFNKNLRRCEDRLFTITSFLHSLKVIFIDNILYHYETNANSLSNKYDSTRWLQESLYLDQLKKEYTKIKDDSFVEEANKRIKNEYILRGITSINNDFFSDNKNSFTKHYQNTKKIIEDPVIIEASKKLKTEKLGLKGSLIVQLIKYRQAFLLTLLNTAILYKNK